jgi:short-subunit dehydrogenase
MSETEPKLAIVVGVGPGMGIAIARRFAKEGYGIGLVARDQAKLDGYVADLAGLGVEACGRSADICDLEALRAALDDIRAALGPATVLVYNGARWHEQKAMAIDPVTFNRDLALCCTGALASAQHVYPDMKNAGRGTLLFTGGGLALHPRFGANVSSLTAGKSALRGLAYAMAGELEPEGIHVATVTIAGTVAEGTAFAPDIIAEHFWRLHVQERGTWATEIVFDGT